MIHRRTSDARGTPGQPSPVSEAHRRGGLKASDPGILREQIGPDEIHFDKTKDHKQNFLDCIKSRKKCITEIAHRSISVGLLGEIAMLTGRKITWDPATETIVGDELASRRLSIAMRAPWTL